MPKQLKEKAIKNAEEATDNLVYVNSGLYSIEKEIQNFANKYASYNKCKQSTVYLDKIIDIKADEIKEIIEKREEEKQKLINALEKDKVELINEIQHTSTEQKQIFLQDYNVLMNKFIEEKTPSFEYDRLKELENQYIEEQKNILNLSEKDDEAKESFNSLKTNLKEGMNNIIKNRNLNSLKEISKGLVDDIKDTFEDFDDLHAIKKEANQKTAKLLLNKAKYDYLDLSEEIQKEFELTSKKHWTDKSMEIKEELSKVITGTTALSDDKRTEITTLIMTYKDICFDKFKQISFEVEDFVYGIKIGDLTLFESDKLNIRKVVNTYNKLFDSFVNEVKNKLYTSHSKTFKYWLEHLLDIIEKNIVSYSHELSKKQKNIEEESKKIDNLRQQQEKIEDGKNYINNMMQWKFGEK